VTSALVFDTRILLFALLATASLSQSSRSNPANILSNTEARKLASYIEEAALPSVPIPTEFTVRVSVGREGTVEHVTNSHSLPAPLFEVAAQAARQWRFSSDRGQHNPHGFEAEITFHGPLNGRVLTKDGTPVAGTVVFGSEWKCCPPQRDSMTTDKTGSFHIDHPGGVLHFLPGEGLQPQARVVTPEMSSLDISLGPAIPGFSVTACREPRNGFERVGWGNYGLQFEVSRREVRLIRGRVDVDYVVHIVNARNSKDHAEFWFGPYAMDRAPADEQFIQSETFAMRSVIMPPGLVLGSQGGVIGQDSSGRLLNGKIWRQMAMAGEGARYSGVSPENAAIFDQIINSACWIPFPVK
jgi:hypothetical protein